MGRSLIPTLRALAGEEQPVAVVLGSGFERVPELVDEIASQFPLAGNRGCNNTPRERPAGACR